MIKINHVTDETNNDKNAISIGKIKNNGFLLIDTFFTKHNWYKTKNEANWVCYTSFSDETTVFDISVDKTTIRVSVPLKNSPYQYIAYFKDYFTAEAYIQRRFFDFIEKS